MQLPSFLEVYRGLIATPSISSSDPSWDQGNREVIAKLADWFSALGFAVEVVEVEPGKFNMLAKKGQGEGGLLLAGHSDTVPFDQGRWSFDPHQLTEKDNKFYGLGTADMKGFFAFIYEAAKRMDWTGRASRCTCSRPAMKKPPCWAHDTLAPTPLTNRITASSVSQPA